MAKERVFLFVQVVRSRDLTDFFDNNPRVECLWYRLLAGSDDFGRIEADPAIVKAQCCPRSSRTLNALAKDLRALVDVGMIFAYTVDGCTYYQITKYDEYQGEQSWTRLKATCPPPPGWVPPAGLLALLNTTTAPEKYSPARYGIDDSTPPVPDCAEPCPPVPGCAGASAPCVLARARSLPSLLSALPLPSPSPALAEESAPPVGDAAPAAPARQLLPDSPPPRTPTPIQAVIEEAWECFGFEGKPGGDGYSGLVKLVQEHDTPKVRAWCAYLRGHPPALSDGAEPWKFFKRVFREAMNRPWEWDGSRRPAASRGVAPVSTEDPETNEYGEVIRRGR